jgi:polycystin 1L2
MGAYSTYLGGGYVYSVPSSSLVSISRISSHRDRLGLIRNDLDTLQRLGWLDLQSRALFVQLAVYNVNINLFANCLFVFELLPTGTLIKTARVEPLALISRTQDQSALKLVCNVLCILLVIVFVVREAKTALTMPNLCMYMKRAWTYVEWLLVVCSCASFALAIHKQLEAERLLQSLSKRQDNSNLNSNSNDPLSTSRDLGLHYLSYTNDTLNYLLAISVALATVKLLRLLRFHKHISLTIVAMRLAVQHLNAFAFVFSLFWLAFAQLLHLIYAQSLLEYSSMLRTIESTFEIMLGEFDSDRLLHSVSTLLGPFAFVSFNCFVVFVMLNMFTSILIDSFARARLGLTTDEDSERHRVLDFLFNKLPSCGFAEKVNQRRQRLSGVQSSEDSCYKSYKDHLDNFERSINQLIIKIERICDDM